MSHIFGKPWHLAKFGLSGNHFSASYKASDFCWQTIVNFLEHLRPSHIYVCNLGNVRKKAFFLKRTSLRFENSVNQFAISFGSNQGLIPNHRWDWRFYRKLPTSKVSPIKLDRNPSQLITFRILWKHKIYANVTHCLLKFYLLASPNHVGVC